MIIFAVIWFVAVLIWDVTTDLKKWRDGMTIDHDKEAWIRVGLLVPSTVGFALHGSFWLWPAAVLMQGFVFWTLMDGFVQVLRGFPWFTPGTTAKLDSIKGKAVIQIAGSILFTILYIWLL